MSFLDGSRQLKIAETQTIPVLDSVRPHSRALQPDFISDSSTNSPRIHTPKPSKSGVDKGTEDGQNPYHSQIPPQMTAKCKHPIVKIVAREEDAEFVECQKCGEVFDSAEFSDIAIEEEEALAESPGED
jgi:hypothetical protein